MASTNRTKRFFVTYRDFSGGMQELTSPLVVADNESPFLSNVQLDKPGTVYKSLGYELVGASGSAGAVKGAGVFEKEDGTNTPLKLHTTTLKKFDGASWISVATSFTNNSTDKAEFINAFLDNTDRIYVATGHNDNLFHWDGTTSGTITNVKTKHLELFNNRLYCGNVKLSTVAYPIRVQFSGLGVDTFDTAEDFFDDVGEPITGMKTYASKLFIWTENKCFVYDGNTLSEIVGDFGTTSARSIQVVEGRMLWYGRNGVYMYAGAGLPVLVSKKVDNILRLVSSATNIAAGIDERGRYVLYLGDMTYGGVAYTDLAIVYDVINNNWTLRPNSPFGCFVTVKSSGSYILYAGDVDNDKMWKLNNSYGNNGSTINTEIQTKKFDANKPEDIKNFWNIFVTYKPSGNSEYLTVKYRLDGDSTWTQIEGTNNNVDLSGTDLIKTEKLELSGVQGKLIQLQITHNSLTGGFDIYEIRLECDMLRS